MFKINCNKFINDRKLVCKVQTLSNFNNLRQRQNVMGAVGVPYENGYNRAAPKISVPCP